MTLKKKNLLSPYRVWINKLGPKGLCVLWWVLSDMSQMANTDSDRNNDVYQVDTNHDTIAVERANMLQGLQDVFGIGFFFFFSPLRAPDNSVPLNA